MKNLIHQSRQVWQSWRDWPVFRVMVRIMIAWWAVMAVQMSLEEQTRTTGQTGKGMNLLFEIFIALRSWLAFPMSFVPVLLVVGVPMMIVWETRRQLTNWRSSLVPNYRKSHLLVAAMIGGAIYLLMAVLPVAITLFLDWGHASIWYSHTDYFPARYFRNGHWQVAPVPSFYEQYLFFAVQPALLNLAMALSISLVTGLMMTWISPVAGFAIILAAVLVVQLVSRHDAWQTVHGYWGSNSGVDLIIFAMDILLPFAIFWRLSRLSSNHESTAADDLAPWLSRFLARSRPARSILWTESGLWQRARHRRRLGLGHRLVWILAAYLAALIALAPLLGNSYSSAFWFQHSGFVFGALITSAITSALAMGLSWPQRFAALGDVELLRPSSRQLFATEMGLAMLCDAAEISIATVIAMLAPVAIWTPAALATLYFWNAVLATVLSQALVFGAILWVMRGRSTAISMAAIIVTTLGAILLIDNALDHRQLAPSLCAVALGMGLAFHAYQRWLRADML